MKLCRPAYFVRTTQLTGDNVLAYLLGWWLEESALNGKVPAAPRPNIDPGIIKLLKWRKIRIINVMPLLRKYIFVK